MGATWYGRPLRDFVVRPKFQPGHFESQLMYRQQPRNWTEVLQWFQFAWVAKLVLRDIKLIGLYPQVSILMTVFNAEDRLLKVLNSVREQVFQDFEVIVIEHGSKDKSLDILKAWGDPRLVLETLESNIGRSSVLNNCLNRANGEFIAILDADDLAHPQRFKAEVQYLNANSKIELIGTWTKFVDENDYEVGSSQLH